MLWVTTVITLEISVLITSVYSKGSGEYKVWLKIKMHGSRKFWQRGSTSDNVFFPGNEGERIQIPLKVGHNWPASETPFEWRFAGGSMMAQHWMLAWFFRDSGPVLLKKPYIFVIFQGGSTTPVPSLDPPMMKAKTKDKSFSPAWISR